MQFSTVFQIFLKYVMNGEYVISSWICYVEMMISNNVIYIWS